MFVNNLLGFNLLFAVSVFMFAYYVQRFVPVCEKHFIKSVFTLLYSAMKNIFPHFYFAITVYLTLNASGKSNI